ncbi:MAG: hypothetical protein Q9198_003441 [Flavoplaca austrocitrina]
MGESPDFDPVEVSEVAAAELNDKDEFDDELAFIIFSGFFEDLHRAGDYVNELWRKYKNQKYDGRTAAVITNAAFELVRQAEEELIAQAPGVFDGKRTYESIAMVVFYEEAFQQGVSPETRLQSNESLLVTTFDDFVYLSTYKDLMKFTYMADLAADYEPTYPAPCPPLRFSYVSRPELLGTPETNRKEQKDLCLSRLIIDRPLWKTFKQVARPEASSPPLEDEFGHFGGIGERWQKSDTGLVMRIKQTSMFWILDNPANAFPKFNQYSLTRGRNFTTRRNFTAFDICAGTINDNETA